MKALIILSFTLFCVACSTQPLTEKQRYERENEEILRIEKYYKDADDCKDQGGRIYIERHSMGNFNRNKPPKRYEQYSCMSDWDFQRMKREMQRRY